MIAAVQKKPELVRLFTNTTEKVQLSAVIASPESVLLMQARPLELKPLTWLARVDVLPASLDLAATEVIMNTTPGRDFPVSYTHLYQRLVYKL